MVRGNRFGITRRTALCSSAGLLGSLLSETLRAEPAETQAAGENNPPELYVFRGRGEATVIATTWPRQSLRCFTAIKTSCVHIHTGGNTFTIGVSPDRDRVSGTRTAAAFMPAGFAPGQPRAASYIDAAVIEVPNKLLAAPTLEVWAERVESATC
jgi:hypothetical protein